LLRICAERSWADSIAPIIAERHSLWRSGLAENWVSGLFGFASLRRPLLVFSSHDRAIGPTW
jgi:hypothetical protein